MILILVENTFRNIKRSNEFGFTALYHICSDRKHKLPFDAEYFLQPEAEFSDENYQFKLTQFFHEN